ncbi:N-formylglutamate amidohydrolase, partial [Rhizobium ruizarguesonis]
AILYDCHSIRSHIPFLFEVKLPDFNICTDQGKTCDSAIEQATLTIVEAAEGYDSVHTGIGPTIVACRPSALEADVEHTV